MTLYSTKVLLEDARDSVLRYEMGAEEMGYTEAQQALVTKAYLAAREAVEAWHKLEDLNAALGELAWRDRRGT